jgi:predicted DNA-binding ribbon-helix-helix protein
MGEPGDKTARSVVKGDCLQALHPSRLLVPRKFPWCRMALQWCKPPAKLQFQCAVGEILPLRWWVGGMRSSTVAKRSIYFGGRVTSVTLEDAFWQGLKAIARHRRMKLPDLIRSIDAQRKDSNLSSAIRLLVLEFYRSQIPDRADREG